MRFPATAPIPFSIFRQVAHQPVRPSLQNSACLGRHQGDLPIYPGVVADKQCTCLASKLMWERYPPTPPILSRETRPKHRAKPHKLR